ncbi:MAG: hypothetical protein JWL95_2427 [Gemmatimonadetes bacterium]|nr:hypothetical protein [Gemmatimonadota bacterium]
MDTLLLMLLRVVHIGAGLFWVGAMIILALFILPAARSAGPTGQQVMVDIMMTRRLAVYLPISAVLSTLAGLTLFWRNDSLSGGAWARSPMGTGMSVGAAAAILAAIIGMGVSSPAARKLVRAGTPGAGGATLTPEQRASLQRRVTLGSTSAMVLLIIATLAMSVARYL